MKTLTSENQLTTSSKRSVGNRDYSVSERVRRYDGCVAETSIINAGDQEVIVLGGHHEMAARIAQARLQGLRELELRLADGSTVTVDPFEPPLVRANA